MYFVKDLLAMTAGSRVARLSAPLDSGAVWALQPGDLFLFKLKGVDGRIAGGGAFGWVLSVSLQLVSDGRGNRGLRPGFGAHSGELPSLPAPCHIGLVVPCAASAGAVVGRSRCVAVGERAQGAARAAGLQAVEAACAEALAAGPVSSACNSAR